MIKRNNIPLVSIVMPCFNRAFLLSRSIDSVVAQSYKNWELIIVDDRSSDDIESVVKEYSNKDNRIKYYLNECKKGPAGARNCGIIHSMGEYIAFLDSDDQWMKQHLNTCVDIMTKRSINVCLSLWYKNDNGKLIKSDELCGFKTNFKLLNLKLNPKQDGNKWFFGRGYNEFSLLHDFYCSHINTLVLNRKVIEKVGMFNEKLHTSEDDEFLFRISNCFGFCFIYDYHFIYNANEDGLYSFIDRDNIVIDKLVNDKSIVDKLSFACRNNNKMRKIKIKHIKNSSSIKNRKIYIEILKRRMARMYFTIGFINRKINKKKAFFYCVKSIIYDFSNRRIKNVLRLLLSNYFDIEKIKWREFDFG